MIVLALTLAAIPVPLEAALNRHAPAGVRVEVTSWDAPMCAASTFEPAPYESSGRVAVRAAGKTCAVWGWATVRLLTTQAIVSRPVTAGEPIEGAIRFEEREWSRSLSSPPSITGAVASRRLIPGAILRSTDVRYGPAPGTPVTVRVVSSGISIEQRGTIFACPERVCATLPSGKRVAGVIADGVLVARLESAR